MDRFHDRFEAGRELAVAVEHLRHLHPAVVGLARGGVEVASEVARALDAPLDVLIARKVGAPAHPEYGIGAVAPGGITVYDRDAIQRIGISDEELQAITQREIQEVARRLAAYRGELPLDLNARCVILVDDGLATGITAQAAVRYARSLGPSKLVFAVPVSSKQAAELVRAEVDEFVALHVPGVFYAVGAWYDDFDQTTDQEVIGLLRDRNARGFVR